MKLHSNRTPEEIEELGRILLAGGTFADPPIEKEHMDRLRQEIEEWRQHPQIGLPMSATITPVIRMYVFRPDGHGPPTYMVAAESAIAARIALQAYLLQRPIPPDPFVEESYTLEMYDVGQVTENDND
jgi:hypothetical protein